MHLGLGFAITILALSLGLPRAQSEWTWRYPLPQGNGLRGLLWTGSTLVTVGEHGTVLTSPDGLAWTLRPTGIPEDLERWRYVPCTNGAARKPCLAGTMVFLQMALHLTAF